MNRLLSSVLLVAAVVSQWTCSDCCATLHSPRSPLTQLTSCHENINYKYALPPSIVMVMDHPESVRSAYGSTVVFNCSIEEQSNLVINGTLYTSLLAWRFNGSLLSFNEQGQVSSYPPHWSVNTQEGHSQLVVTNTSAGDDGYYECVVGDGLHMFSEGMWRTATLTVSKRAWLNSQTSLGEAPVLGLQHRDVPGLKGGDNKAFVESCAVTGPNQTLYWYKDGRDITEHYDSSTGQLRYSVQDDLYGVYQCFVENSAGSDFVVFRVLEHRFANPPSNFSCRAVDNADPQRPKLIVSWGPPSLVVGGLASTDKYRVRVNNYCYDVGNETCAEIPLYSDLLAIHCSVYVDASNNRNPARVGGVAAVPVFSTLEQRRYAQDAVHHLNVTCSSHDSASITASLPDPEIISDYAACLETIRLWGVCLFGDREEEEEKFLLSGDLDASDPGALDDECSSTAPYVLSVPAQPPGTVCLFGGDYSFPDNPPLTVPPVPCGVSAPEGDDLLSVTCSVDQAILSWKGQGSVNVSGKCYTPEEQMMHLEPTVLSANEEFTAFNLTLHSICTFSVINQSVPLVQCIAGGTVPRSPTPTTPPSHVTTIPVGGTVPRSPTPTTPPSHVTTNPKPSGHVPLYVWVILSLFVSSLFLVTLISVCLVSFKRHHRQQKEKELCHILASVVEHQLPNPQYPPVDPYAVAPALHWGSNFSIHTELDSLHASRTMLSQQSPTSFLGVDDSGATTPSEHLVQQTEEYLYSSGSSSGYGTTHSEDSREYYQQRLNDVADVPQDRTNCVREYFEPDLEGYVHMVPYKTR